MRNIGGVPGVLRIRDEPQLRMTDRTDRTDISLGAHYALATKDCTTESPAHQLAEDVHLQPFVVAFGPVRLDLGHVHGSGHVEQALEHFPAVGQVPGLVGGAGGAHRLDVEADAAVVAAALQHPDRVEGPAQVDRAEHLVLVVLQAVLVVEVDAPQLAVPQGVGHVVGRVEAGQDRVGRLDQHADARRLGGAVAQARKWPGVGRYAWSIGSFGFISPRMRMFLSYSSSALTASRMRPDGGDRVLGLADVGALAGQPQDDVLAAEGVGDVDGTLASARWRSLRSAALLEV